MKLYTWNYVINSVDNLLVELVNSLGCRLECQLVGAHEILLEEIRNLGKGGVQPHHRWVLLLVYGGNEPVGKVIFQSHTSSPIYQGLLSTRRFYRYLSS